MGREVFAIIVILLAAWEGEGGCEDDAQWHVCSPSLMQKGMFVAKLHSKTGRQAPTSSASDHEEAGRGGAEVDLDLLQFSTTVDIEAIKELQESVGGIRMLCGSIIFLSLLFGLLRSLFSEGSLATPLAVAGLMASDGSMLVLNKLVVTAIPVPPLLLTCQLCFCACLLRAAGGLNLVDIEPLRWSKVKVFGPAALGMIVSMFLNMKVLQHTNVDTLIPFKSATPLITVALDHKLLGREWPELASWLALLGILISVLAFLHFEAAFIQLSAYFWIALWMMTLLFDTVYIKIVMNKVCMTPWTRAYYTNALGLLPCVLLSCWELQAVRSLLANLEALPLFLLLATCVQGTALSVFSFYVREELSSTSFLIVGHMCKILSTVLNVFTWHRHSTKAGLCALGCCLASAACYREAPLRQKVSSNNKAAPECVD